METMLYNRGTSESLDIKDRCLEFCLTLFVHQEETEAPFSRWHRF